MQQKKSKKKIFIGILIIFLIVIVYAFTKDKGENLASTIRISTGGEPGSLDPQYASGDWESKIINNLFSGLFITDARGEIIPELAQSYEVSKDGKTYTFHLRNAKWSDGVTITAEDFVYSYKRMLDPKQATSYAQLLYVIKGAEAYNSGKANASILGVKAINDQTLEIQLEYPASYFIKMLPHYAYFPVPRHIVEKHDKAWIKLGNVVTSGAYILTQWKPNSYIKATKNPQYWDSKNVKIENVDFYTQDDSSVILKRFRAGEIDIMSAPPTDQLEWVKENLKDEFFTGPALVVSYFAINVNGNNKALHNKEIRKALSMAIDREFIIKQILKTDSVPAYSIVPFGIEGYNPASVSWQRMPQEDRIKEATKILKANGYTQQNPLKVDISYNTLEDHKKLAVAMADMWKQIGVQSTLSNSEVAVHFKNLENHNFDIGRAGWIADYNEASSFLYLGEKGNGNNYATWANEDFEKILNQAKRTTDEKKKNQLYQQAEKILLEDVPYITISYGTNKNLVAKRIGGFENNIADVHLIKYLYIK